MVSCVVDAPGKLATVNSPNAGSLVRTPMVARGTRLPLFAQMSNCENDPPIVKVWEPFSRVTVSSIRRLVALRDCGDGLGPALVNCEPIMGNCIA